MCVRRIGEGGNGMKQGEKMSKYKEYLKYGFDRKPSTEELSDETIIEMTKSMDIDTQKILDKLEEIKIKKALSTLIDKGITPEQYEKCYKDRLKKLSETREE